MLQEHQSGKNLWWLCTNRTQVAEWQHRLLWAMEGSVQKGTHYSITILVFLEVGFIWQQKPCMDYFWLIKLYFLRIWKSQILNFEIVMDKIFFYQMLFNGKFLALNISTVRPDQFRDINFGIFNVHRFSFLMPKSWSNYSYIDHWFLCRLPDFITSFHLLAGFWTKAAFLHRLMPSFKDVKIWSRCVKRRFTLLAEKTERKWRCLTLLDRRDPRLLEVWWKSRLLLRETSVSWDLWKIPFLM